jgi:hypothetical protein
MASSFGTYSQSAFGLLPEISTLPSGNNVADEWYILGMLDTAALDHLDPDGCDGSKYQD